MLSHDQRTKIRDAVKNLFTTKTKIETALRRGETLDDATHRIVTRLTGTQDLERQWAGIDSISIQAQQAYMDKLREMAPDDLTAFAEYMNPDEPPARHHIFLCEEVLMPIERRDLLRGMISMPPGHGKALALDTPILTTAGWTTFGELKVGDRLYGPDGRTTAVIRTSEIFPDDHCFLVWADGEEIVCNADHLWTVFIQGELKTVDTWHLWSARRNWFFLPPVAAFTDVRGVKHPARDPGYIQVVRHAKSVPTRCITVDREDGLFLVGHRLVPTHNSVYSSRLFPAWYMGRHPSHRYIQAGHTQGFCEKEFGARTKAIIDSERYRDVFPEIRLAADARANGYWGLANFNGSYLTRGVGQGIAGFRANCGGVDDPYATREDAESKTTREKVWDWFSADFTTRLLPFAPMFIVMTRWHVDDLGGRVEDMNKKGLGLPWRVINLPAFCEDSDEKLGRILGEPLWPAFFSTPVLNNLRETIPIRDWNSLYRGQPTIEDGNIINQEWFKFYEELPPRSQRRRVTISVDSANTATHRSDFSVVQVWIETFDRQQYLAHQVRRRVEFPELVSMIETTARAWNADAILIEDRGSGTQYAQSRQGKAPAPVIPIAVGIQSKEFRFDAVAPQFQAGMVFLPKQSAWIAEYIDELMHFPNGKNDDQVDATSQYLSWARPKGGYGATKLHGTGKGGTAKTTAKGPLADAMRAIEERSARDPIRRQLEERARESLEDT